MKKSIRNSANKAWVYTKNMAHFAFICLCAVFSLIAFLIAGVFQSIINGFRNGRMHIFVISSKKDNHDTDTETR